MTDRKTELLAAIRATDDDQPKLVYADWLEDHGDVPRANLIRLQCRVAETSPWEREAVEATWEIDQLLIDHGARFRAELPELAGIVWGGFAKGFVSSVVAESHQALMASAAAIQAAAPVTKVALDTLVEESPPAVLPWLRTLGLRIDDSEHHIDPEHSLVSQACELEFYRVTYEVLEVLSQRAADAPLERLLVEGPQPASTGVLRQLVELRGAKRLRTLVMELSFADHDYSHLDPTYFANAPLRREGAEMLANAGFDAIEVLEVSGQHVGADGLAALLASMPMLRELGASRCQIDHLGFLNQSTGAPLVRLALGDNPLGDAAVTTLVASPRCAALESLELDATELYSGGVAAITHAPCWNTLRVLDLGRNPLGVAGAVALAGAARPARLHTLLVANCDLTEEAARILADIPWLDQLLTVDLSKNLVDPRLLAALTGVRDLRLSYVPRLLQALVGFWPHAVKAVLNGTLEVALPAEAPELTWLELDDSELDAATLDRLTDSGYPRLRSLSLSKNALTSAMLARLVQSPLAQQLHALALAGCGLDDAAAQVLADADLRVAELDLRNNPFTETGLLALTRAKCLPRVIRLRYTAEPWLFASDIRHELDRHSNMHLDYADEHEAPDEIE